MGEAERGRTAPRVSVTYWCADGHETQRSFAVESGAPAPAEWDCPRCGAPAGQDRENPPQAQRNEPYKTHLAYVKERRTEADGQVLLDEAIAALHRRRPG